MEKDDIVKAAKQAIDNCHRLEMMNRFHDLERVRGD
jgi:hypothetical protein